MTVAPVGSLCRRGDDYYAIMPDFVGPGDWVSILHVKGPKLQEGEVRMCTRGRPYTVIGPDFQIVEDMEFRMMIAGGKIKGLLLPRTTA